MACVTSHLGIYCLKSVSDSKHAAFTTLFIQQRCGDYLDPLKILPLLLKCFCGFWGFCKLALCVCVKSLHRVRLFATPWTVAYQAPPSMGFSRHFSISPSNEYSGLISFRIDWLNLLAVQGTNKSLLQHHSLNASDLQHFPGGSGGKESACSVGNPGLIPGLGSSPGEGNGHQLQYSRLENFMDRGSWPGRLQSMGLQSQT